MKQTLLVASVLGTDLRTRSFFRNDMESLIARGSTELSLDFTGVDFISRSVADEIYNLLIDYPFLDIKGMEGDVASMYEVVVKGRNCPREYPHLNAKVYHLKNMKEMRDFFATI